MRARTESRSQDRRQFLKTWLGGAAGVALGGVAVASSRHGIKGERRVWQIDPAVCVHCGKCATECVLPVSAVKCVHTFSMCGYCKLCFGYFEPEAPSLDTGGENQLCPTGAIQRTFLEDPYFEYTIDEELCVGCARCVKGCTDFGNGSLYLQVRHDLCVHCTECAIARTCPVDAFKRVPAAEPYLRKGVEEPRA